MNTLIDKNYSENGTGKFNKLDSLGQTLSEIAKKNHTTVAKLRKLNGIKGSNIRAGKKLRVR
ncbi:hypothetical protein CIK98_14745 [Prevotella sp. P2-180]|nr:hypothetical protein CIK98_14745 [Prevotella sp. P2-180]